MPRATPPAAPGSGMGPAPQALGTGRCVFPAPSPGDLAKPCPHTQKAWATAAGSVLRGERASHPAPALGRQTGPEEVTRDQAPQTDLTVWYLVQYIDQDLTPLNPIFLIEERRTLSIPPSPDCVGEVKRDHVFKVQRQAK